MSLRRQERPHSPARAIGFGCAGTLLFTMQDASFKWFSADYAVWQIIFLRSLLALLLSVLWLRQHGGLAALRVTHPYIFACSIAANITAWYCFYTGLSMLPLTISICVFFLTPVIIATAAVPLLGEALTWRQIVALLCGFSGVLVITNPLAETAPVNLLAIGWILISVVMWAIMALVTRALTSSITIGATLLYNNLAMLLVSAVCVPAVWTAPTDSALIGMIALGVLGLAAQGCVFAAYRAARSAVAATAEYTALVWAILLGWLIWDEVLDARSIIGTALIIAAGMIIIVSSRSGRIKI